MSNKKTEQLFSPFISRLKPSRRVSRFSIGGKDLIDWDAPEIPEIERQKIIYEDIIAEIKEDHVIEQLIGEHIVSLVHDVHLENLENKYKQELAEQKQRVAEQKQEVSVQKQKLAEQMQELAEQKQKQQLLLSQHGKLLQDNQAKIEELEELKDKEMKQDEIIRHLQDAIQSKDVIIEEMKDNEINHDETVRQLQVTIQSKDVIIEEREHDIEEIKKELDELRKAIKVLKTLNRSEAKYQRESEALHMSFLESFGSIENDDDLKALTIDFKQKLEQFVDSY